MQVNGYGEHNIQGIGDKHVPLIHNVMNLDYLIGISDSGPDLLRGLLAALHAMELEILVKNVDTPGELERLRVHGFHAFQGIAIAPAMSGDEATAWLRAQHDQAARKAAG